MRETPETSAVQIAADLAAKRLRATDFMDATLERIDAVNPKVNAIVGLRSRKDLIADARRADQTDPIGPLHGVPIAVKDLVNVSGVRSTMGSPLFANHVPEHDDMLAARLRRAGAILIGKTNTPEFGLGSNTFNSVYGATRNPYDASKTCGGSSGGAAVALSTGMTVLADGSDMMGSLRNPAAWNNVYGLRPSWGRVPSEPTGGTFLHHMSTLGPMAQSPQDIALLLDVLSGPDPRQPHGVSSEPVHPLSAADLTGKKIGWLGDWGGAFAMEPGIVELCESALRVFEDLGAEVDSVAAPFDPDAMWDAWVTLRSFQVGAGLESINQDQIKDTAQWELSRYRSLTASDLHRADVIQSEWFQTAYALASRYDALVLPCAQVWPFDAQMDWPKEIAGQDMDTYHRWMQVAVPVGLIGLPALAVPAGFGASGLPMGFQLFGARGADRALLEIGAAYHNATRWPQTRPPLM